MTRDVADEFRVPVPAGVALAPPPPRALRVAGLVLVALFVASLPFPYVTTHIGFSFGSGGGSPPHTQSGWEFLVEAWPLLIPLALFVVWTFSDAFRRLGKRTPLFAFAVEAFYLDLGLVVLLPMSIMLLEFFPISRQPHVGVLGLVGLATVLTVHLLYLLGIGGPVPAIRQLVRHPPWRRWNRWLLPGIIVSLLVGAGGVLLTLFAVVQSIVLALSAPGSVAGSPAPVLLLVLGLAFLLFHSGMFFVSAIGLWQRQSWAPWLHLWLSLPLAIIAALSMRESASGGFMVAALFAVANVVLWAWSVYLFVAGLCLCANMFQRARCAACGRMRWVVSRPCRVCSEWVLFHKDHAGAPVCLACGSEQPETVPLCRECRAEGNVEARAGAAAGSAEAAPPGVVGASDVERPQ